MATTSSTPPLQQSSEKALRLINLVYERSTPQQWAGWLRVPLEHAAATGDVGLVNDILTAGAGGKPGWKGWHDRSLCVAVEGGHHEVVEALLTAAATPDVNIRSGEERRSPLHHAASGGHKSIVRLLLKSGADVECVDRNGRSPLHLAVLRNHEHVVDELLDSGAPPNCPDKNGDAPIHMAARLGHDNTVSSLLRKEADIDILDRNRRSPLHIATSFGHLSTVEVLLAAGADVDLRDGDGVFALNSAAVEGHVDAIRTLHQPRAAGVSVLSLIHI